MLAPMTVTMTKPMIKPALKRSTAAIQACFVLAAAFGLTAPCVQAQTLTPLLAVQGAQGTQAQAPWRVVGFPDAKTPAKTPLPLTRFEVATVQGERALKVSTQASYGTLVHELPQVAAGRLQWRWRLDQALTGGKAAPDILSKAGDDAALKVCVMFDHPLSRVPFVERTLLRVARSVSGEDLPAATLCYLWDSTYPAGTQGDNPYSRRVRFISLQGLGAALGQWQNESRDVAADFAKAFADELPAKAPVPTVRAVLIGADSDNTGSQSLGWVQSLDWVR
jgi:hypothetical protein